MVPKDVASKERGGWDLSPPFSSPLLGVWLADPVGKPAGSEAQPMESPAVSGRGTERG